MISFQKTIAEFIFDALQKHDDSNEESCPRSMLGSICQSNTLMDVPSQYLMALFESTKKITGEIVPKDAINIIMTETIKLLDCDRCSLFVYDKKLKKKKNVLGTPRDAKF